MADDKIENSEQKIRYRLTVADDTTFEEKWRVRFTKRNGILLVVAFVVLLVGGTFSLVAFTGLRGLIPGYPNAETRRDIMLNAVRLDSLEQEIELRDRFFANMNSIISGNGPTDSFSMQESTNTYLSGTVNYPAESTASGNMAANGQSASLANEATSLSNLHFFPPLKGMISGSYDPSTKHFGTDIVAGPKSFVSSVLDGTVIFTGWTMETGYVIEIQHTNNIVSVYKHNTMLLKEMGDDVRAGEPISIVGDSGELYTSGPHLHVELWYKGESLDPEKHILF